jgi:hypothetical protein
LKLNRETWYKAWTRFTGDRLEHSDYQDAAPDIDGDRLSAPSLAHHHHFLSLTISRQLPDRDVSVGWLPRGPHFKGRSS